MTLKYRIAAIGDVHIGAVPPEHLEDVFLNIVIPGIEAAKPHAIIQLGDWFDKRLSLDSPDSKMAFRLTTLLAQLGRKLEIPVRMVKGTLSHDYFQLQNYYPLEYEIPEFRVCSTAAHEELLPGFDVLWMPEEYPTDYGDFYGRLLYNDEGQALIYDGIFGHGEIDVAAGWSAVNEGERHYGGTPCHSAELLLEHSSGPVWFGHVHNRFRHKKRLGYPGSLTRWCQGEEADKGFDILTVTEMKNGGWKVESEVIVNTLAPIYKTVVANEILGVDYTIDQILDTIREAAQDVHKLRVKMLDFPISVEDLALLRGALVNERHIELATSARAVSSTTTESDEEGNELSEEMAAEQEAAAQRLSYLRDPLIPGEERLLRYLHEKNPERSDVSLDEVRELTAPLVTR